MWKWFGTLWAGESFANAEACGGAPISRFNMPRPAVIANPQARTALKRGFDKLADLLAVMLGPMRGVVLSSLIDRPLPELLGDTATIARRVIELPDRSEDVGAMLLRNLVWRVHQKVGDGAATAAVLAQAILDEATPMVTAGANPMLVKRGINRAGQAAMAALAAMAQPVSGEDDLTAVAQTVTGETDLSLILGEVFDLLGPYAHISIQKHVATYLERVYLNGGRWEARLASRYLVTDPGQKRAILQNCQIAVFDGRVADLDEVLPLLELAAAQEPAHLLLVAHALTDKALGTMVATHQQGKVKMTAVIPRRVGDKRAADLADLALLTGAQLLSPDLGQPLGTITVADIGHAKRVEASAKELIVSGRFLNTNIRQQITSLAQRSRGLPFDDEERGELQMRLARLSGSAAILHIGAPTKAARKIMYQVAEQGIKALAATVEGGVVPGGGVAYLDCRPAVNAVVAGGDEKLGVQAVARALTAPFTRILKNAGVPAPAVILEDIQERGSGYGYDVRQGEILPLQEAGLLDPAKVARVVVETAVSGAAIALSTDAIVLKRQPEISVQP